MSHRMTDERQTAFIVGWLSVKKRSGKRPDLLSTGEKLEKPISIILVILISKSSNNKNCSLAL